MDIEEIVKTKTHYFKDVCRLKKYVKRIVELNPATPKEFSDACRKCQREYKMCPKKAHIIAIYREMVKDGELKMNENMDELMTKKLNRKYSGVEVITVLTSPFPEFTSKTGERKKQKFSCGKDCFYCPNEGQIDIHCEFLEKIETGRLYSLYRVRSSDQIDQVRVLTYFHYFDENGSTEKEEIPVADSKDYDNETREFTLKIYNKFTNTIDERIKTKTATFLGTKIEQPRSYISTEPAVRRANANNFDPVLQFYDRAGSLSMCGHIIDKLEILVLGGTWSHYPVEYQEEFIRDIYYAANTFYHDQETGPRRERLSLEEEIELNQTATSRIIGLTLETRPDAINKHEIQRFRKYGCTRVQLGVQHIDDEILKKINRGCYTKHTKKALHLLKQNGYKVDIHLMPDLYGSDYDKDIQMFDRLLGCPNIGRTHINKIDPIFGKIIKIFFGIFLFILVKSAQVYWFHSFMEMCLQFVSIESVALFFSWVLFLWTIIPEDGYKLNADFYIYKLAEPDLQADQWKIYPTEVTRWTKIFDLYQTGEYKPYAEEINEETGNKKIVDLILYAMRKTFPWIRLNRVIRDIPTTEIYGGNLNTSLRQVLEKMLVESGTPCRCIRSREVKNKKFDPEDVKLVVRRYGDSADAYEYFISYESKDESTIYGFCRLRLNSSNENVIFPELIDAALIRELHVYGLMVPHNQEKDNNAAQHMGFGRKLLKAAEEIAQTEGYSKIAVISGIGVRKYYEKNGYQIDGTYMTKSI